MSLYNMINGVNPATFFILPMLGEKHPDQYPRFRDCFVGKLYNSDTDDEFGIPVKQTDQTEKVISVYTRVGGGNRNNYVDEIKELQSHPNYIKDYNDSFDSTFATFLFSVPKEFESDYDLVVAGRLRETSAFYQSRLYKVYPKLSEVFDKTFSHDKATH